MKHANNSAFQERPDILDAVGVDIPLAHVSLGMIHGFVSKFGAIKPEIGCKLIGVNYRTGLDVFANEGCKDAFRDVPIVHIAWLGVLMEF